MSESTSTTPTEKDLSPEEARMVIKAIEAVEKEEAEEQDDE